MIAFSESALVDGNPIMDVIGKGIITCVEGCSSIVPSPYIILSSSTWVEAGGTIIQSEIIMVRWRSDQRRIWQ